MKKIKLFSLMLIAFIFTNRNMAQKTSTVNPNTGITTEERTKEAEDLKISKEIKNSTGTFILQSISPVKENSASFDEGSFNTADGGTATFLIMNESEETNPLPITTSGMPGVTIFPNPFKTTTTVTVTGWEYSDNLLLTLYDVFAREVKKISINNEQTIFDKGDLPCGIYFFQVNDGGNNTGYGRFIIN